MIPNRDNEERRRHSTSYKPYSYYECRIPYDFVNVPMHWHSEFEINYVLRGEGDFICGNDRFRAKQGDMFVIPPNMLHAAYPGRDKELIYQALVFHPVMLGANLNDRCTIECIRPLMNGTAMIRTMVTRDAVNYGHIKACMEQIFMCVTEEVLYADLLLKSELMKLFWLLETDGERLCREDTGIDYCEIIRPALEYMIINFRENVSVVQLADLTHLSQSYFMGCFKRAVGISAIGYLAQLRINAACEYLSSTGKKISDIAFECGYGNLSNFNRQFKKITGYSPNEYRKYGTRLVNPLNLSDRDYNRGKV